VTSRLAAALFDAVWPRLDRTGDGTVPTATEKNASPARAVAATAVQAATFAGTKAAVDRFGVRVFYHLTGLWAGDPSTAELEQKQAKKDAKKARKAARKRKAAKTQKA
jgi:hypothetical protein